MLSAAGLAALIRQSYASKLAADVIAGAAAASLARRQFMLLWYATTYARPAATACLGAAAARAARQRQHRRLRACLRLQSVFRGHMDRGWVEAYTPDLVLHRQMLRHVVTIQAAQRGHVNSNSLIHSASFAICHRSGKKEVSVCRGVCHLIPACAPAAAASVAYCR